MKNTQLALLLSTLSSKEVIALKKWINSPFFNQRTDVIQLLDFYLKHYKKHQEAPAKTKAFSHLFPNESYNDHKIRMVISFLNKQTEQFLIYQKQQELLTDKLTLLEIYRERKMKKAYQKVTKGIEKKLAQTPLRNANYYRLKYRFHLEQIHTEESINRFQLKKNIQAILDTLDISILIEKIRESISALAHEKMADGKYDLGLYRKLVESLEENPKFLANPTVAIYHAASLVILYEEERKYFDQYAALLEKSHTLFSKSELLDFYTIATNYLGDRLNLGEKHYSVEIFSIYKKQLDLGLFDEKIVHYAFKNIIVAGLHNEDFDWTEQFIKNYTPKLAKEHQHSMSCLGFASLARRRGQTEKALQLLKATKFEDVIHNMTAKRMITMIYYEQKKWEALQMHLKAFEVYIRRLKNMQFKANYLEMILFTQKVFRLNPYDKKEKAKLIQFLEHHPNILDKAWLLMCLNNM